MGAAFRTVRGWHGPLAWFTVSMIILAAVCAVGYAVDDRVLVGMAIWAKPLKFSISFALYGVTLAWMLSQVQRPRWRRIGWWAGTVLVVVSVLEMVAIVGQVVRGAQSHFNFATPFDGAVFTAMGILISVLYVCTLVVGVVLLRSPMRDAAFTWALRLGVLIAVVGLSVGFLMLTPTPAQDLEGPLRGAHTVGPPDGGPSLPFVGWSTTGGDLRVAHFLGMHGLQALPLFALALTLLLGSRLVERTRLHLVLLAGALYGGVVILTLWQALRGQAVIAPDGPTLVAAGALLVLAGLGVGAVVRAAPHRPQTGVA